MTNKMISHVPLFTSNIKSVVYIYISFFFDFAFRFLAVSTFQDGNIIDT